MSPWWLAAIDAVLLLAVLTYLVARFPMSLGKLLQYLIVMIPAALAVLLADLVLGALFAGGVLDPLKFQGVIPYVLALYGAPAPAVADAAPEDTAAYKTVLDTIFTFYGIVLTGPQVIALFTPLLARVAKQYPVPAK